MNCANCEQQIKSVSMGLYNHLYENIFSDLPAQYQLNECVWLNVCEYLINFNGHIIQHTKKSRIKPDHMDYDSDGEYYWEENKHICTLCFQYGIVDSLNSQRRLPYTRRDIYYFINENMEETDAIYMYYFLPNKYIINFYRQDTPLKIDENLYRIESKGYVDKKIKI